jgi:hypothetical protein
MNGFNGVKVVFLAFLNTVPFIRFCVALFSTKLRIR